MINVDFAERWNNKISMYHVCLWYTRRELEPQRVFGHFFQLTSSIKLLGSSRSNYHTMNNKNVIWLSKISFFSARNNTMIIQRTIFLNEEIRTPQITGQTTVKTGLVTRIGTGDSTRMEKNLGGWTKTANPVRTVMKRNLRRNSQAQSQVRTSIVRRRLAKNIHIRPVLTYLWMTSRVDRSPVK